MRLALFVALVVAVLALIIIWLGPASAHDEWANGGRVPDWVKSSCCGPADAHRLRPDQVYDQGDYYIVDGYHGNGGKVSHKSALPSQDGNYWIFYRDDGVNGQTGVYCFFVPMAF